MSGTVRDELLTSGIKSEELDTHESDLYVVKNTISSKWLEGYKFKHNVTEFISSVDGTTWYDIPFGAMSEHMASKGYN